MGHQFDHFQSLPNKTNGRGLSRGGRNSASQFSSTKTSPWEMMKRKEQRIRFLRIELTIKGRTCLLTPSLQPCTPATALCFESFLWDKTRTSCLYANIPKGIVSCNTIKIQANSIPSTGDGYHQIRWLFLRCFRHLHPAVRAVVSRNDTTTPSRMHCELAKSEWFDESCRISQSFRPKVISPLALPLRTLMPSCIFCFQDVSTARWFPVISGSPFWTYSFLFLILQACSFDLLLLSPHFPMLLLHFLSFSGMKPLMLHESKWSFWILHYLWCQHAKYPKTPQIPRFPSFPNPANPINSPCVPPNGVVDTALVLSSQRFSNLYGFRLIFPCLPSLCLHLCTFFFRQLWNTFLIFDEFQCLPWLRHAPSWAWRLIGTASFDSSKVQEVALRLQRFRGEISWGKVDKLNTKKHQQKNNNLCSPNICLFIEKMDSAVHWASTITGQSKPGLKRDLDAAIATAVSNWLCIQETLQMSWSKKHCMRTGRMKLGFSWWRENMTPWPVWWAICR